MSLFSSRKILYSDGGNDEYMTPMYAVKPLVDYFVKLHGTNKVVWCPFDKETSNFVIYLRKLGVKVIRSHIDEGKDFYTYTPDNFDFIISNPPFTNKRKIFERALLLNKPFALLMSNTWLNDSAPKQLFYKKDLQLFMFEDRVNFIKADGTVDTKTTFSSSFYCYNFLDKQIIMSGFKL